MISQLLKKALKSDIKTHKLAAFAFTKSGALLASACNLRGSGSCSRYSLHAEENLVNKLRKLRAKERFGYIKILVLRKRRGSGEPAMAKPCDRCNLLLNRYGVREIAYSGNDGEVRYL